MYSSVSFYGMFNLYLAKPSFFGCLVSYKLKGFIMLPRTSKGLILSRTRGFGLLLRVFAMKEQDVPKRVAMVREFVERARKTPIKRVDVVVWYNKAYGNRSDCGMTFFAMQKEFESEKNFVHIHELTTGDLYVSALNFGISEQVRHVDFTVIASPEARSYFTPETFDGIVKAHANGARVCGVAITELEQSILEGRLSNTYCSWHISSLMQVGMFDKMCQFPLDPRAGRWLYHPVDRDRIELYYPEAGVEEIPVLCYMALEWGAFTATILPTGEGVQRYEVPTDPVLKERHLAKMTAKLIRQQYFVGRVDCTLDVLKAALLSEYRAS